MTHGMTSSASVAVGCDPDSPALHDAAAELAGRLGLQPARASDHAMPGPALLLVVTPGRLELHDPGRETGGPLYADFVGGPTGFRRLSGPGRNQLIGRAVGLRWGTETVLDATGGLCRDAFLLACLGCRVMAVERSPILCAMVHDGVARARRHDDKRLNAVLQRLAVINADARAFIADLCENDRPDVVYLDPMYPPTKGTALSRKEMRMLRMLVGDDADACELLDVARQLAPGRVVVKRRRHAPPLAPDPDIAFKGRTVRYDVYLPK